MVDAYIGQKITYLTIIALPNFLAFLLVMVKKEMAAVTAAHC